jgi:hypothetical protein
MATWEQVEGLLSKQYTVNTDDDGYLSFEVSTIGIISSLADTFEATLVGGDEH